MTEPRIDLTGTRVGFLTVVEFSHASKSPCGTNKFFWRCKCDCGNEKIVQANHLRRNIQTTSCGCKQFIRTRRVFPKGYLSAKKVIDSITWRCYNPNATKFDLYGGRGIIVCNRWLVGGGGKNRILCFLEDMGPKPSPQHSIERIDVNGNYEPGNCKWATPKEQAQNRRNTIKVNGMYLTEIADKLGFNYHKVNHLRRTGRLEQLLKDYQP